MGTKKEGTSYFVTMECFQRQPLMARPLLKQMLFDAIQKTRKQFSLHVAAYVILDNHVHLVFMVPAEGECLAPMNYLRARMTRILREQEHLPEGSPFWGHGMKLRQLGDSADLRAHIDYIHYDPVRHGLCERAFDYPWSSLPARVEQGHYPEDWAVIGPPASLSRIASRH